MISFAAIITEEKYEQIVKDVVELASTPISLSNISSLLDVRLEQGIRDLVVPNDVDYKKVKLLNESQQETIILILVAYCMTKGNYSKYGITLGDCYFGLGKYTKAITAYEAILNEHQPQIELQTLKYNQGKAFYFKGDVGRALDIFTTLEGKIFDPEFFYLYGCSLDKNGESFQAIEWLKKAYSINKDNIIFLRKLIYLCLNMEKYHEAIWYLEIYSSSAKNKYVKSMMSELYKLVYDSNKLLDRSLNGMIHDVKREINKNKVKKLVDEFFQKNK